MGREGGRGYRHTCSHGVKKEEKLPHSRADIKRVERLLEAVELRQSWNELQYVVLQVLCT